jgi:hypothetical protein
LPYFSLACQHKQSYIGCKQQSVHAGDSDNKNHTFSKYRFEFQCANIEKSHGQTPLHSTHKSSRVGDPVSNNTPNVSCKNYIPLSNYIPGLYLIISFSWRNQNNGSIEVLFQKFPCSIEGRRWRDRGFYEIQLCFETILVEIKPLLGNWVVLVDPM